MVCRRDVIWLHKLKEFPDYKSLNVELSLKDTYTLLYNLTVLKDKLKLKQTVYEIYNLQELDLEYNQIETLPKEIENLSDLQIFRY